MNRAQRRAQAQATATAATTPAVPTINHSARINSVHDPIPLSVVENIKNMIIEIERMKDYCLHYYERGGDYMVECWATEDYEDLFYVIDLDDNENSKTYGELIRKGRRSFHDAWEQLRAYLIDNAKTQAELKAA